MASRYSTEEVISMLDCDLEGEDDIDDPGEPILEGSDEEFGAFEDMDEAGNGTVNKYKEIFTYNCYYFRK